MRKIGIIGTRRRNDKSEFGRINKELFSIIEDGDWLVSGGCPEGGDKFADDIAKRYGIPILTFYPDWETYNRSAGFERNTDIAIHSDILIARVHPDRKGGTEDTIKKFIKFHPDNQTILIYDDKIVDSDHYVAERGLFEKLFGGDNG